MILEVSLKQSNGDRFSFRGGVQEAADALAPYLPKVEPVVEHRLVTPWRQAHCRFSPSYLQRGGLGRDRLVAYRLEDVYGPMEFPDSRQGDILLMTQSGNNISLNDILVINTR